ncbi:MAG TPA: GGDEF domain-containing protein [Rhodanobacter sp.]
MLPEPTVRTNLADTSAVSMDSRFGRLTTLVLGADTRRRIRLTQWGVAALVYIFSAPVVWLAVTMSAGNQTSYAFWCVFQAIFLIGIYTALRSGWSERLADPSITAVQMMLGVIAVEWAYVLCGPLRSMTLYPLLLIFAFGAFSLGWRQIMWLTLLTLVSLLATVAGLHMGRSPALDPALHASEFRLDLINVLMITIALPALSLIAAQLSIIRRKLRSQRAALTDAMEEVQRLATHDHLTGLVNRRCIQQRLMEEQHRFQRHGSAFSVAIIDLDNFKRMNDTQGHAFGDQVLQAFAAEAVDTLRTSDVIARWGGEEFLAMLPDTRAQASVAILQRLLGRMARIPHGTCPPLTFSAGVTEIRRGESANEAVARADAAMYEAKASGRNTVRLADPAA